MTPASSLSRPGRAFDVTSDVHGCLTELESLLDRLGYGRPNRRSGAWRPPRGRHLVIAGDVVDRGPLIPETLDVVLAMADAGAASVTIGNHDDKLLRWFKGRPVKIGQGLEASIHQMDQRPRTWCRRVEAFLAGLPSHLVLDDGALVVAHAGLEERFHGVDSKKVRDLAMFGRTRAGEDQWGLPIRLDWAAGYEGRAAVVYGHTPVVAPVWRNGTIDIDTGCVFGGALTAVRWPEREVISVQAERVYQEKSGPFRVAGPGGPPVDAPTPR